METVTRTRHANQKIDRELDVLDRGLANLKSILDQAEGFRNGVLATLVVQLMLFSAYTIIRILIRWAILAGGVR